MRKEVCGNSSCKGDCGIHSHCSSNGGHDALHSHFFYTNAKGVHKEWKTCAACAGNNNSNNPKVSTHCHLCRCAPYHNTSNNIIVTL